MRPFQRTDAPAFLAENAEAWGEEYARRKGEDRKYEFSWYKPKFKYLNHHLVPLLSAMTDSHCSYCDAYPPGQADETIDHFCPKGDPRFYHLAYTWSNLYIACANCQKGKLAEFEDGLLRPDDDGYSFERYFVYDYATHEISVNPAATEVEKNNAATSIRIFNFNHPGQKEARRIFWRMFSKMPDQNDLPPADRPFRFILPA